MNAVLWVLKPSILHKYKPKHKVNGYDAYGSTLYLFAMENLKILPWTTINIKDSDLTWWLLTSYFLLVSYDHLADHSLLSPINLSFSQPLLYPTYSLSSPNNSLSHYLLNNLSVNRKDYAGLVVLLVMI